MALRVTSLKTRTAAAIASVIAVVLVANAVYLILAKRREMREEIEERALNFAMLTRASLGAAYEASLAGNPRPLVDAARETLRRNPDLVEVSIVDGQGRVRFDSSGVARPLAPAVAAALARGEASLVRARDPSGEELVLTGSRHTPARGEPVLIVHRFSYRSLRPAIARLVYATAGLTLLSILLSAMVAAALASRITRPIEELTTGAQEIAEGHFDRRLSIRSNDELQILADAFNYMAQRLKENVEQLEDSNRKLADANTDLQQLDRMKSDLLANVSHELRTPLTAIKGYTDYIIEGKLGAVTDKQEKGLTVVRRNLERLTKTINALLDFSRMEAGRISLHLQPFGLAALVEQVHGMLRAELDRKRLTFAAEIEPALPPVIADREKISAVLENLLVNAIKFTPEGGRVTVSAARAPGAPRAEAEVRVSDTGAGIPADQLEKVFARFHQVDSSSTRRFGGVGLGLAIVKSILDAHGAPVSAQSEESRGTTFRFTLPLLERAEMPAANGGTAELRESLVLLMERDPRIVRALGRELEEEGFSAMSAGSTREAAALASERGPDAVVIDLTLPDRAGLELLRELKRDPSTRRIPVLAAVFQGQSARAVALGAADSLLTPARESIVATMRRLLDGPVRRQPVVLVVDREPDAANAIRDTLAGEGFVVQVAHDARQAVDLIDRSRPDAIVLDVLLPEQSSLDVLEALRREKEAVGLPPVLLTARPGDAAAAPPFEIDPARPLDVRALISELRRLVRGPVRREAARQGL